MTGVLLLAKKLDLDPFSKEIYAIPGRNDGPVMPVIAFDGWMKILLRQSTFDGMETLPSDEMIEVDGYPRKGSRLVRMRHLRQGTLRIRFGCANTLKR